MLAMFSSHESAISIVEADWDRPPALVADPAGDKRRFALIAVNPLVIDDENFVLAAYVETGIPRRLQIAIRREAEMCTD